MDPETAIFAAERFVRLRMGERAIEILDEFAPPDDARRWLWRANALHVLERFDEARDSARVGIGLAPSMPYLHMAIARAELAQMRLIEAEAAVREALRVDSGCAEAKALLALVLWFAGRREEATRTSAEAMKLAPGEEDVRLIDTLLTVQRDNFEKAEIVTRQLLADIPDHAAAHWMRGLAFMRMMRFRAAARHFREAAALDAGNSLFRGAARTANHWLLWPLRMTMPAGWYVAFFLVIPALNIGVASGDWRLLGYAVAFLLYAIAGVLAVLRVHA